MTSKDEGDTWRRGPSCRPKYLSASAPPCDAVLFFCLDRQESLCMFVSFYLLSFLHCFLLCNGDKTDNPEIHHAHRNTTKAQLHHGTSHTVGPQETTAPLQRILFKEALEQKGNTTLQAREPLQNPLSDACLARCIAFKLPRKAVSRLSLSFGLSLCLFLSLPICCLPSLACPFVSFSLKTPGIFFPFSLQIVFSCPSLPDSLFNPLLPVP